MNIDPSQRQEIASNAQYLMDAIQFNYGEDTQRAATQHLLASMGFGWCQFESPGHAALLLAAAMVKLGMQA